MAIWFGNPSIEKANEVGKNTASENLGIVITEMGEDSLSGTMPVDERTRQPMGLLHGGASVLFAETLCSLAASFCVDRAKQACVGQEINANHLRSATKGLVYGVAKNIYLGRRSQVWEIRISDEDGKLVCISRCTMATIDRPSSMQDD
ncbi:hotdog fold thioesterase [Rhodovibrionaceae bacterium A322]